MPQHAFDVTKAFAVAASSRHRHDVESNGALLAKVSCDESKNPTLREKFASIDAFTCIEAACGTLDLHDHNFGAIW